jgi:hypothetical protein
MTGSRQKLARIRLVARTRFAYEQVRDRATPERRRRFIALNRALALLALRSA